MRAQTHRLMLMNLNEKANLRIVKKRASDGEASKKKSQHDTLDESVKEFFFGIEFLLIIKFRFESIKAAPIRFDVWLHCQR
jgi:hypothetical protein